MKKMLTFQGFDNRETAEAIAQTLMQQGIPAVVEQNPSLLDGNFIGQDFSNHILLKLWPGDFERAQKILIDSTVIDMKEVDRNYVLFQMTDTELKGVLAAPEEWGAWNYKLAAMILAERGVTVTTQQAAALQETHIGELSRPKSITAGWLLAGYGFSVLILAAGIFASPESLLALFSVAALPGILGVILGLILIRSRKTLPDGRQAPSYDSRAQSHGYAMLLLCILSILFSIVIQYARYN
jgi:hypothetical protein